MKKFLYLFSVILLFASCAGQQNELNVISFNLRLSPHDDFDGENSWLYRKDAAGELLNTVSPDMFGIQEAEFRQIEDLKERLPQYTWVGFGLDEATAGCQVSSLFYKTERFNLLDSGIFWLSETPDSLSRGWDAAMMRLVTWVKLADLQADNKEVYYFNTHFDHIGKVARAESAKLICSKVEEIAGNDACVFITGDFNTRYSTDALAPLREKFSGARETSPITDTLNTFNDWGKNAVAEPGGKRIIDHIYYQNVEPIEYKTIVDNYGANYVSDHYPIMFRAKY